MNLSIGLLGPLETRLAGKPIPLPGRRQRVVLALLLLDAERTVTRDQLLAELWADHAPTSAGANMRTYVSGLRDWFGEVCGAPEAHRLVRRGFGWRLEPAPGWRIDVDVTRFEADFTAGRQAAAAGDPVAAAGRLRRAVVAHRGTPLQDVPQGPSLTSRAAVLLTQWQRAVQEYTDVLLYLGDFESARHLLYDFLAQHPYQERAWGQLMVACYRDGDVGAAVDAYRSARTALADGLGLEPGTELKGIHQSILRRDPALDRVAPGHRRSNANTSPLWAGSHAS